METPEFSIEWYKQNLPEGVTVNEQLTKSALPGIVCMDIDIVEYPSLLSQMSIINYIELALGTNELEYHYSIMDKSQNVFQYMSAREFREEWGYDNKFFEHVEPKYFGKRLEDICTVIPKEDEK